MFYHLRFTFSILFFFLISVNIISQENPEPSPGFTLGAFIGGKPNQAVLDKYDSTGFNCVAWGAYDDSTRTFLSNYDVWATNAGFNTDWISYYATSYYSKWEGEQNEAYTLPMHVGVKHKYGQQINWHDTTCWSSLGLTAPACSLMFGPHYRQDQRHKSWYHTGKVRGVEYFARFNLALNNPYMLNPNKNICVLKVVYRYAEIYTNGNWTLHDTTFMSDTLTIADFNQDGSFKLFDFNGDTYQYPDTFYSAIVGNKASRSAAFPEDFSVTDTVQGFFHDADDNGIQFCVDYLGNDSTTLFIDYAEVYDKDGWDEFMDPQTQGDVINKIQNNIQSYSGWPNIKYWYGQDEPYSIDAFTPIHIIDSLVNSFSHGSNRVVQYVQPFNIVNGDTFIVDYYKMTNPDKLIIDPYPFSPTYVPVRWEDLDDMHNKFQVSSSLQPGFWFVGQTFGEKLDTLGNWYVWRLPDSTELKASLMQALAHGVKGLYFWIFNSYTSYDDILDANVYTYGMVDTSGNPTSIWYLIHDNIIPRLSGNLGNKLLGLNYNGDFIQLKSDLLAIPPCVYEYLTLGYNQTNVNLNWHCGFLDKDGYSDDKYFFLVNLITNATVPIQIKITPPVSGFTNFRFRNYEGYFDTTFTGSSFTYTLTHSAGEGYLYEVAPVIEYGGKLYASETINNNTTLYEDMTIEDGVILTINTTYNCYGNIYIKGTGKIVTTNGGTINFHNGRGIIAEGTPQIYGTSSHKLTLDFGSETEGSGIQILQGTDFKLEYCLLKNATNLVSSSLSQNHTSISHSDFQNTASYAISLSGSSTFVPSITYCTFTNTDYGIFSAGQSSITISNNNFTDNITAVSLSQIPSAQILFNSISSDLEADPGIILSSCGGNLRENEISGHTIGATIGNSSLLIGSNTISHNKVNGIYITSGSVPDLRASLVGRPPNQYPISGYNSIFENGGYCSGFCAPNDDGSEISFSNSNCWLNYGCNYIADNRTVSPPLQTTLRLMNGTTTVERLFAAYNAWGDTVYPARFGNLTVTYNPHNDTVCPLPVSEGLLVIQDNDGNPIDTVYSTGEPDYTVSSLDLSYSEAAEDMIGRNYSSADNIFSSIITSAPGDSSSQNAYLGLYKSKRLQNADSVALAELRELYNSNIPQISDSVMMKVVSQLSLLTLVDEKQYNEAMLGFYDIISQNPQSDEALFAEIDAMTTSLLAQNGSDTTLGRVCTRDF